MNAHIEPFYRGDRKFSFYPYYLPSYYSNYYPRHYTRYYEPVSSVTLKKGPVMVETKTVFDEGTLMNLFQVVLFVLLFVFAVRMALRN